MESRERDGEPGLDREVGGEENDGESSSQPCRGQRTSPLSPAVAIPADEGDAGRSPEGEAILIPSISKFAIIVATCTRNFKILV
jgi:hypothetical protein